MGPLLGSLESEVLELFQQILMSQDGEDPFISSECLKTLLADRHGAGLGQRVRDDLDDALHHLGVPLIHRAVHREGNDLPGAEQ